MYTRDDLARRIADASRTYEWRSRWMAAVAVVGGLGQLWLHRILENRLGRAESRPIELAVFVVYIVLTTAMLLWTTRGTAAMSPRCPVCGAALMKMSARMALTTGRCDQCGGQVIE